MKKQIILFRIVLLAVLLLSSRALPAQARFEISTGAGLFDGIFIKAKYGHKIQVGLSHDLVSQLHTTGLEIYYRLPLKSVPGIPGPFYLMCGISSTLFGKGYDTFEQIYIYPRIGRSFLIPGRTSRVGLNADLGVVIHLRTNPPEGYLTDVIPVSGSLGFFYRF